LLDILTTENEAVTIAGVLGLRLKQDGRDRPQSGQDSLL
jgi:hypothetical protein